MSEERSALWGSMSLFTVTFEALSSFRQSNAIWCCCNCRERNASSNRNTTLQSRGITVMRDTQSRSYSLLSLLQKTLSVSGAFILQKLTEQIGIMKDAFWGSESEAQLFSLLIRVWCSKSFWTFLHMMEHHFLITLQCNIPIEINGLADSSVKVLTEKHQHCCS